MTGWAVCIQCHAVRPVREQWSGHHLVLGICGHVVPAPSRTMPASELSAGDVLAPTMEHPRAERVLSVIAQPGHYITVLVPSGMRHFRPSQEVRLR
jgi:hypothetical protein